MALSDHLREFRARILKCVVVLVALFCVALYFYNDLLVLVQHPYNLAKARLPDEVASEMVVNNATGGLLLNLKVCGITALIAAAPFWLYQAWAFVLPGLHANEKKWTRVFVAVAGPLFLAGVAMGYYVLPKGLEVLINFTPAGSTNLVEYSAYFSFLTRMLLVFGISMEIPVFVILLNLAGIVSGRALGRARPWIVIGTFVFAAVATPSTDPFSMLMLAIPMLILFALSEIIARLVDRARGRGKDRTDRWSDDQISTL